MHHVSNLFCFCSQFYDCFLPFPLHLVETFRSTPLVYVTILPDTLTCQEDRSRSIRCVNSLSSSSQQRPSNVFNISWRFAPPSSSSLHLLLLPPSIPFASGSMLRRIYFDPRMVRSWSASTRVFPPTCGTHVVLSLGGPTCTVVWVEERGETGRERGGPFAHPRAMAAWSHLPLFRKWFALQSLIPRCF